MKLLQSHAHPGIGFFTSVAVLLAAPVVVAEQAELVDRAKEAGLADAPGYGKAVSMVDVNGDGWEDLWDSNTNRRPPSPDSFKPYDLGIDPDHLEFTWGAAWADFDNDGDPDLLLGSGGFLGEGSLALYENRWKEEQKLVKLPAGISTAKRQWWGVSWADFNNDGCLDFAAIARKNREWVYQSNCDKTFTE
ncbi:MAG: VCBS repeat-containing protein, partial [Deltaproteobacteria bacterium]|nr:VCBS repeat-containing protein [Deltaproteobacteria bacterium]